MPQIIDLRPREILDSRGNPTVEVDCVLSDGYIGRASVPSGASTGSLEACELRDNDMTHYLGKGVLKAVGNIKNIILPKITSIDPSNQKAIDQFLIDLDGTEQKKNLGANAILGVSLAVARAMAKSRKLPLFKYIGGENSCIMPTPMMNIINGGMHADNKIDIQEFMIMPITAGTMPDAVRVGTEIFHTLKSELHKAGYSTNTGDEGGFAPNLNSAEEALDFIILAIEKAGYQPGTDVAIALDAAATEFYKDGIYDLSGAGVKFKSDDLISYYEELLSAYPIISIEDGMAENDVDGWKQLSNRLNSKIQLVGDDLFVTNPKILKKGIENNIANAILIKLNQIGTLTETLETIRMAQEANYKVIISHRSGETEDTSIAHLAVATNAGQIKTGSLARTDRTAKYNELIRINELLGDKAIYRGE